MLYTICKTDSGFVTTAHYKAIDKVAPPLKVVTRAPDSIKEAVEWLEPKGKPYLLVIQWHPERMPVASKLSTALATRFVREAKSY